MKHHQSAITAHHVRLGKLPGGVWIASGKQCNVPNVFGLITDSFHFTEFTIGLGNTSSQLGCARWELKSISDMMGNHVLQGTMEG
jgi:hypothetical protein